MTDWLDDLAVYLQAQGIGTVGSTLFIGGHPKDVGDAAVVVLRPTGGKPTDTARLVEYPTAQVMVRAAAYADAFAKALAVYNLLNQAGPLLLNNNTRLQFLSALQPPFFVGRDERNGALVSCNYQAIIGGLT